MTYANPTNITSAMGMFRYSNEITGIFGTGIQFTLFSIVVIYLIRKGEQVNSSFVAAGYITSIISVFLMLGGLITQGNLFVCILLTALSVLWTYYSND